MKFNFYSLQNFQPKLSAKTFSQNFQPKFFEILSDMTNFAAVIRILIEGRIRL